VWYGDKTILALAMLLLAGRFHAETPVAAPVGLLSNGNFTRATEDPTWPDDWKRRDGISWERGAATARAIIFLSRFGGNQF
jgi:hypothetical protein